MEEGRFSKLNLNGIFLFLDIGARNHTISIKQTNRKEHWTQIANAEMYFFHFFFFFFYRILQSLPGRKMHF